MKNNRKSKSKHFWWIYGIAAALIIVVPYTISAAYFLGLNSKVPNTMFTAGELLMYYGAILASAGTAAGVFYTIKYTQENYREDQHKRVFPYIVAVHKQSTGIRQYKFADSRVLDDYFVDIAYLYIRPDDYDFFHSVNEADKYKLEYGSQEYPIPDENTLKVYFRDFTNSGVGTAIDLNLLFRKHGDRAWKPAPISLSLLPGQSFRIEMIVEISEHQINDRDNKYYLNALYSDIYGNEHPRRWEITFYKDGYMQRIIH